MDGLRTATTRARRGRRLTSAGSRMRPPWSPTRCCEGKGARIALDHHARLSRRARAAALGPREPLRSVPGRARPCWCRVTCDWRSASASTPRARVVEPLHLEDVGRGRRLHPAPSTSRPSPSACCSRSSTTPTSGRSASGCGRRSPTCRSSCRARCLPEIREFERTSTTAVCAYVGPILASYLGAPRDGRHRHGIAVAVGDGLAAAASSAWPKACACRPWRWSRDRRRA